MVQAELRSLESSDVPNMDLQAFVPDDSTTFGIPVGALIGPLGHDGEELFSFFVCTPNWLYGTVRATDYVFGKGYLFLPFYTYQILWNAIEKLCTSTSAPTWMEVGIKLSRYSDWEFENYTEL